MSKFFKILFDVIFVIVILCLSIYFVFRLMGTMEIYKVQTGSMEDGIHAGDYILVFRKNQYVVGDVVTYEKDGYHVTHRIIKKNGDKVITKGDANNIEDDEISVKNIVGKAIYNGGLLNIVINYKFAIAGGLLAIYLFSYYLGTKKEEEEELLEDSNYGRKRKKLEDLLDINSEISEKLNEENIDSKKEDNVKKSTKDVNDKKTVSKDDEKNMKDVKTKKTVKKSSNKKGNSKKKSTK